jgi:hypothetical protein
VVRYDRHQSAKGESRIPGKGSIPPKTGVRNIEEQKGKSQQSSTGATPPDVLCLGSFESVRETKLACACARLTGLACPCFHDLGQETKRRVSRTKLGTKVESHLYFGYSSHMVEHMAGSFGFIGRIRYRLCSWTNSRRKQNTRCRSPC